MNDKIATALIFLAVIFGLTAITLLCLFLSNKSPAAGTVQAETTEPIVAKTEPQPEQAKARADAAGVNVLDFGAPRDMRILPRRSRLPSGGTGSSISRQAHT